jgi:hypothetical protein
VRVTNGTKARRGAAAVRPSPPHAGEPDSCNTGETVGCSTVFRLGVVMRTADDERGHPGPATARAIPRALHASARAARAAARAAAERYEERLDEARRHRLELPEARAATLEALGEVEAAVREYARVLRRLEVRPEHALVLVKGAVLASHACEGWQPDALRDRLTSWFIGAYFAH